MKDWYFKRQLKSTSNVCVGLYTTRISDYVDNRRCCRFPNSLLLSTKCSNRLLLRIHKYRSVMLCNVCLTKGHSANKCQRGRNCFIAGCDKRHYPLLHSNEKARRSEGESDKGREKESTETKSTKVPDAQTAIAARQIR